MRLEFPAQFLWGASTACDSFHRWPEDLDIAADVGLTAYRFSIEWAGIEPADGRVSNAMLAHYRQIIEGCLARRLMPVVTLHHFTLPNWFRRSGGWRSEEATERFSAYVKATLPILDGVEWVCTINEPNMVALIEALRGGDGAAFGTVRPDEAVTTALKAGHVGAVRELRALPGVKVGWTLANQVTESLPGGEEAAAEWERLREDQWLEVARCDDFVGVQAYSRQIIGREGPVPPGPDTQTTQMGWELYPAALGEAVRHTSAVTGGLPHPRHRERDRHCGRHRASGLHRGSAAGAPRGHGGRCRRPWLPPLVTPRQLRVGFLPSEVRSRRSGPHELRTDDETERSPSRFDRPGGGARHRVTR